jgi:hypothetical protein
MLERNFRFFHAPNLKIENRRFKTESTSRSPAVYFERNPMSKTAPATVICQVCKKPKSPHDGMMAGLIRPSLLEFIKKRTPQWDDKGFICLDDLGEFRKDYVREVLEDEIGELSALDQEVVESLIKPQPPVTIMRTAPDSSDMAGVIDFNRACITKGTGKTCAGSRAIPGLL